MRHDSGLLNEKNNRTGSLKKTASHKNSSRELATTVASEKILGSQNAVHLQCKIVSPARRKMFKVKVTVIF